MADPAAAEHRWTVWLTQGPREQQAEVARLLIRDCSTRGITVQRLEWHGGDRPATASTPAVVIAHEQPAPRWLTPADVVVGPAAIAPALHAAPGAAVHDTLLVVLHLLEAHELIPDLADEAYTAEDEEQLRQALDNLGYL